MAVRVLAPQPAKYSGLVSPERGMTTELRVDTIAEWAALVKRPAGHITDEIEFAAKRYSHCPQQ
jgi:hypothetical protein